ncbi:SET domain-containing protein [Flagellimonas flava]|uniref:SET domain-containing protein n=1 Tax=Flagellimonas flava TaxID=570519 RepID=UPI003D6516D5
MIHPNTEIQYINDEIGYGVVAKSLIPMGTITWVLDEFDQEFTPTQIRNMAPVYQEILDTYAFKNNLGNMVLCWDNGRFVNHSFNSNCLTTAYNFELAIRDILPGEQLTDDYGYLNMDKPFKGIDEGTRRKTVYPDDLLKYHKGWDKKLALAFNQIGAVEQPLAKLISRELWGICIDIQNRKTPMKSILANYYKP